MGYTIKKISDMTQLPASTLRYYEKEHLLPVNRKVDYYNAACEAGTETFVKGEKCI